MLGKKREKMASNAEVSDTSPRKSTVPQVDSKDSKTVLFQS